MSGVKQQRSIEEEVEHLVGAARALRVYWTSGLNSPDFDLVDRIESYILWQVYALNDRAVDEKSLVGRLLREGVGDGYALYVVSKETKLDLIFEHLPLGDCWRSSLLDATRGRMRKEVAVRLKQHSRNELFGRNSSGPKISEEEFRVWFEQNTPKKPRRKNPRARVRHEDKTDE